MGSSPTLPHADTPLKGRRILVVEDEYYLADDIVRALRSLGAEIAGPFGHLDDAVHILKDGDLLDGAVLDVNIGTELIFPIAQELQARQVPFVFTTGYDRSSVGAEFQEVMLWEKPIDVAAMIRSLTGLMRQT